MSQAGTCTHGNLRCLNQHDLIRNYRCTGCGTVMMCACDEAFGRRFLAHQLDEGVELETQERVQVTLGFQPATCNGCRGRSPEPAPAAAIHGRTTKIKRFYWRELFFLATERMADWKSANPKASREEHAAARKQIGRDALDEIEAFRPRYTDAPEKGSVVVLDGIIVSPETFVARHFEAFGWSPLPLESLPLHACSGS